MNNHSSVPSRRAEEQSYAGLMYALAAFLCWGLAPVYFKSVAHIDPLEVLAHRVVWSAVLLTGLLLLRRGLGNLLADLGKTRSLGFYCITGTLLSANWLIFIWAIASERLIEASLGYYINPLISVLLGMMFLGERLNSVQWIAVGLAGLGVAYQVVALASLPWVSLMLAVSFGAYGLLRKKAGFDPIRGLLIEALLMSPFALLYLAFLQWQGLGAFGRLGPTTSCLLAFSGVVTSIPLVLFLEGARRIRLVTVGLMQYLTPTVQLLLAVWVYAEPFSDSQGITFGFIWAALLVFSIDALRTHRATT